MGRALRLDRQHVVERRQNAGKLVRLTLYTGQLRHQPGEDCQQHQHGCRLHMQHAQRQKDHRAQRRQRSHLEAEGRSRLLLRVAHGVARHLPAQLGELPHLALLGIVGLHALQVAQVLLGRRVDLAHALGEVFAARPHAP